MAQTEVVTTVVSPDGVLVVPRSICDRAGLHEGMDVEVRVDGDQIVLSRPQSEAWKTWRGRLKGVPLQEDLAEERRRELERDAEKGA